MAQNLLTRRYINAIVFIKSLQRRVPLFFERRVFLWLRKLRVSTGFCC